MNIMIKNQQSFVVVGEEGSGLFQMMQHTQKSFEFRDVKALLFE